VRENLACKFRDVRRTVDVLFANLRTFTRYNRFAERQSPFARSRPNDWYQPRAHIAWRRHDGPFWLIARVKRSATELSSAPDEFFRLAV